MLSAAASHVFCKRQKCVNEIGHEPSGGQIVKSHEISVFIMLSCWIRSSNENHFSRSNCTQTLILCKFTC